MRGLDDQISGGWSDWDDDPWGCDDPDPDDSEKPAAEPELSDAEPADPEPDDGGSDDGDWGTMDPGWGYGAPATLDMLADDDPTRMEYVERGAETTDADNHARQDAKPVGIDDGADDNEAITAGDDAIRVEDAIPVEDVEVPAGEDAVLAGSDPDGADRGQGDENPADGGDVEGTGGVDAKDMAPADDQPTIILDAPEPPPAPSHGEAEPDSPAAAAPTMPEDDTRSGSGLGVMALRGRNPFAGDEDNDDGVDGAPAPRKPAARRLPRRVMAVAVAVAACLLIVGAARSCASRSALRTAGESCSQATASASDALKGLRALVKEASKVDDGDGDALTGLIDDARSMLDADAPACPAGEQAGLEKAAGRASRIAADAERVSGRLREAIEKAAAELLADASERLSALVDEADSLLSGSEGKVADETVRDTLADETDKARDALDGDDPAVMDELADSLTEAMDGVRASMQARTEADEKAEREAKEAADAAAAQAQQSQAPSYTPSYTPSYAPSYTPGYTPSYTPSAPQSGGSSSSGGSQSSGGWDVPAPSDPGAFGDTDPSL